MSENKIVFVGISGPAGAGKDTLASHILSVMEGSPHVNMQRMALADALKEEAATTLGIDIKNFYDRNVKEHYRPLLQWWGTEYRRNEAIGGDNDYWVKKLKQLCHEKWGDSGTHTVVLVPDVRFDNEARFCLESGGIVIQIDPVNQPNINVNAHVSEKGISEELITLRFENDHKVPMSDEIWLNITDRAYADVFYGIKR